MKLSNSYIPILLLFVSIQFISFSSFPPYGNTNAPGEGLCQNCHTTPSISHPNPVTSATFEFIGISDGMTITPNTTYPLQIKLSNFSSAGRRAGFQLVALEGNENNSGSIGTFTNLGDRVEASTFNGSNRIYLRHSDEEGIFADPELNNGNVVTYTADWVSPAVINGPIYFYTTGIVGNNGGSDGDFFLSASVATTNPLPVELSNFQVKQAQKQEVEITWETASENNSDYFEVLRSLNGIDYTTLEKITAAGQSSHNLYYSYIDKNPILNQTVFYRLKQVDLNGKFIYSNTKAIEVLDFANNEMSISPNPVLEGECIFVDFLATKNYPKATLEVFDTMGREISDLKTNMPNGLLEGFNKIIVDTSNLPTGVYFLNVHDGKEILANQAVVVK